VGNSFRYSNSSPEVIRFTVMMYVRYPLSLRQVEDLLFERGIDICHETARFWWNPLVPMFAPALRKRRVRHRSYSNRLRSYVVSSPATSRRPCYAWSMRWTPADTRN
jgi:transposase-like protein